MRSYCDYILTKAVIFVMALLFISSCATIEFICDDYGSDITYEVSSSSTVIDSLTFVVFQQTNDAMIIANHIEVVDGVLVLNMSEKDIDELNLDMYTYLIYKYTIQESNK